MYKEKELQKISSYSEKEVKNIQNENKELEKIKHIKIACLEKMFV